MNDNWKNGTNVNTKPIRAAYKWAPDESGHRLDRWQPSAARPLGTIRLGPQETPVYARRPPVPSYPFDATTGHRISDVSAPPSRPEQPGPVVNARRTPAPGYDFSNSNGRRIDDGFPPDSSHSTPSSSGSSYSTGVPYNPLMGRPGTRMDSSDRRTPYDFAGTIGRTVQPDSAPILPTAPAAKPKATPEQVHKPQMGRAGHIIKQTPAYNFGSTTGHFIDPNRASIPPLDTVKKKVQPAPHKEEEYDPSKPWLRKRGNPGSACSAISRKPVVDRTKGQQVVPNSLAATVDPRKAVRDGLSPAAEAARLAAQAEAARLAEEARLAKAKAEANARREAEAQKRDEERAAAAAAAALRRRREADMNLGRAPPITHSGIGPWNNMPGQRPSPTPIQGSFRGPPPGYSYDDRSGHARDGRPPQMPSAHYSRGMAPPLQGRPGVSTGNSGARPRSPRPSARGQYARPSGPSSGSQAPSSFRKYPNGRGFY